MKVVEYNKAIDILVEFEQGNTIHTTWDHFIKGNVRNPYDKTVFGVGFVGEGNYQVRINNKTSQQYIIWHEMLRRCYCLYDKEINRTYKDCTVSEEWHNFQNFAKWYDENYYQIDNETMSIDKDILLKGNKIYSPETCIFTPQKINTIFTKSNSKRGDLPIGVCWHKRDKVFVAQCHDTSGTQKRLGNFYSIEDAFRTYKNFKENVIKQVAEKYKNRIPEKLYNALITYQVEITD